MADMIRITAVWAGAPGLPGYSQFYWEVTGDIATQAQVAHNAVKDFFTSLATLIPYDIHVTVDPVYQVIIVGSGETSSEAAVGSPSAAIAGGYVGNWNAQVGVLVEWLTSTFIGGRRLRGRTYLVPLGNTSDDDGTLPAGTLSTITTASAYITVTGTHFVVWHRPVSGAGGQLSAITSAVIRDHAAVLRSRMI